MGGGVPAGRGSGARPTRDPGPPEIAEPGVIWPVVTLMVPIPLP